MSSVKINGKKYRARRLLPNELAALNISEPVKLVSTSAGERLAVKQDDKWVFYTQKPINTVRL